MSKIINWIRNKVIGDDETIITKERLEELEDKEELLVERMEATGRIIELPEEENKTVEDKPTTTTETTQSTLLPTPQEGGNTRKRRKYYKTLWKDENKEGVIKEYSPEISFYYHYDKNQSPQVIRGYSDNHQKVLLVAEKMMEFNYDHTKWKRLRIKYGVYANPPRNEDGFQQTPYLSTNGARHIYYNSRADKWYIQKKYFWEVV